MNSPIASLLPWAPAFALVLARIGATMALLPGLGESIAPATVRIGLALCLTALLLPAVQPLMPPLPDTGTQLALMLAAEVVTGLWFGWIARQAVLALPIMGQIVAYMIGLSSVLQPDPELGGQATALSKLFESAAPLLFLMTGLYRIPLLALSGLFTLIPPGSVLPAADGAQSVLAVAGTAFGLALQLASPFIVMSLGWHLAMGMLGRLVGRMQIYFVSAPGLMLAGFLLLLTTLGGIVTVWQGGAEMLLLKLPGG